MTPSRRPWIADWIGIAVIVATTFLYNGWLLDARIFFFADDWVWLYYGEFLPWREYLAVLPAQIYNDRPVGGALIKVLYQTFAFDRPKFQIVLLSLHAVNCVLIYRIAARYAGLAGALLTALLAATWISTLTAVGWPAAIFDLLGATLCLSTLFFRQLAIQSDNSIRYDLPGVACYLLAIRTKEFALGLIALLLLMHLVVERQRIREALRQLLPYLIVFAVYALWYLRLIVTKPPSGGTPYALDFSIQTILASLGFYVSTAFYAGVIGVTAVAGMIVALAIALIIAGDEARRIAAFGFAGFVILLGPTLLLATTSDTTYHSLYLYAPHFFLALVIGALCVKGIVPAAIALALSLVVLTTPASVSYKQNIVNFYVDRGEMIRTEFFSALRLLSPLPKGATVFVSGVEPFHNPFSSGPGLSLKTAFKDRTLDVVIEKPDDELLAHFCRRSGPKRFLRFVKAEGSDVTAEMESRCDSRKRG